LPSLITLANLACGVGALLWLFEAGQNADYELTRHAGWLLVLAVFFDAIDGKLARITKGTSELGAQLDSLADLVTFGVVPAFLVRTLVQLEGPGMEIIPHPRLMVAGPILYTCCAALRLARFNVLRVDRDETRDHSHFLGLPSPAAAALPIGLVLFYFGIADPDFIFPVSDGFIHFFRESTLRALPFLLVLLAILMVSNLSFPHFMAWLTRARHPFQRTAEVVILLSLLFVEPELALFLLAVSFIFLPSVIGVFKILRKRSSKQAESP
jgi:CDP-diacylglycerol--serine O-phosphatidyltransferase